MPYTAKDFKVVAKEKGQNSLFIELLDGVDDTEILYVFEDIAMKTKTRNEFQSRIMDVSECRGFFCELREELDRNKIKEEENEPGFYEWLEEIPTRKQNLPRWEQLRFLLGDDDDSSESDENITYKIYQTILDWNREEKISDYWEIYKKWLATDTGYNEEEEEIRNKLYIFFDETKELKFKNKDLETNLNDTVQKLDQLKNELSNKEKEEKELRTKLTGEQNRNQELENNLTTITLSAGLLAGQISELENEKNNLEGQKQITEQKLTNLENEIKELIKQKSFLEINNEKLTKNVEELQIQVNRQKDQISSLQGEQKQLEQQLEDLKEELNLTPENPEPEKKSLREKIKFFNNFLKKTQQEKSQLEENIKEEQKKSEEARVSLIELEEQLKGASDNNKQQILNLNQTNNKLRSEIKKLENNLKSEQSKVIQLQKDLTAKIAEAENLGITLKKTQAELVESNKAKPWKNYLMWGAVIVLLVGIGWFIWRKITRR